MPQDPQPAATVQGSAPAADLSQWELPDSTPDPITKPAPSGASGVRPPPAESPAVANPKHSARALRLAAHLGISQAEIDASSRDDLLHEIRAAQAEQDQIAMETRRGRALDAQERPAPKPEAAEPPLWTDEEAEWEVDDATNPGQKVKQRLVEGDLAPPLVKLLKKLHKELAETKGKLAEKDQAAAASSREQEIDAAFNALPDEYKSAFGTGTIRDLTTANDPSVALRQAVWAHLTAHPPKEHLSVKDAVAQRAKALYGRLLQPGAAPETSLYDQPAPSRAAPAAAPRKPAQNPATGRFERPTEEEWEEGALARPTQRVTPPAPKGRERAIKALGERMRAQRQAANGDGAGTEWDDLPD